MNIRKFFLRRINMVLAAVLTLLGFSNCEEPAVEYGVPNADYTIKGTVVDKANAKAVKGIRVGLTRYYPGPVPMYGVMPQPYYYNKADTTNVLGEYQLTDNISIGEIEGDMITVFVQDIDGDENGLYSDITVDVDFKGVKAIGKKTGWYDGEYIRDVKIEITKKLEGND